MRTLLIFMLGLTVGGICGVVLMCCLQINKLNQSEK